MQKCADYFFTQTKYWSEKAYQMIHGRDNLSEQDGGFSVFQATLSMDFLVKLSSQGEFHDEKDFRVGFDHFEQSNDVRVVELFHRLNFSVQHSFRFRVQLASIQNFHGHSVCSMLGEKTTKADTGERRKKIIKPLIESIIIFA